MRPENLKNDTKFDELIKITNFLLVWDFTSRDFLVGIGVLHECTDFHTCT